MQDEVIQRFEDRCTEANAEIQQLQAALQDASKRLETADNRLSSTMDSRNKLRKQLEAKHSEMTSMQASLAADSEVLKVTMTALVSRCCIACMQQACMGRGWLRLCHACWFMAENSWQFTLAHSFVTCLQTSYNVSTAAGMIAQGTLKVAVCMFAFIIKPYLCCICKQHLLTMRFTLQRDH